MRKAHFAIACVAVAFSVGLAAQAQDRPKRKPGLWEAQLSTTGTNVPDMQERLASMPPEKRAQAEEYMKQRGMSFGAGSYTQTMRYCLTPEQSAAEANKPVLATFERNLSRCEEKVFDRTASSVRFHAVCKTDEGVSEFDGRVYDLSPVSAAAEFKGKSAKKGEFEMKQKARWLAADCGNVK